MMSSMLLSMMALSPLAPDFLFWDSVAIADRAQSRITKDRIAFFRFDVIVPSVPKLDKTGGRGKGFPPLRRANPFLDRPRASPLA